jgi:hypothetical protein
MNCPKTLSLIKESQELHKQALVQIQHFSETFFDMRPKKDLNIFTELRKINTEYERLKKQIGENIKTIEKLLPFFTPEAYLTSLHPFMLETYKKWSYNEDQLKTIESVTSNPDNIHIDEEIPFDTLKAINSDEAKREANKSKAGELYLTSEHIDFETATPIIPTIPEGIKKLGISGVMKYIHDTYKDTHILPDLKYYQYLAELADKHKKLVDQHEKEKDPTQKALLSKQIDVTLKQIPEQLRDGNQYYFPGSAFVNESGRWLSPYLRWNGVEFDRSARRVENSWASYGRVVLLER